MNKNTTLTLAHYQSWANQKLFKTLQDLAQDLYFKNFGLSYHSLHGTLNHLIAANQLWQYRITGFGSLPSALNTIFHEDLESTLTELEKFDQFWINYVKDEPKLDQFSNFKMQNGNDYSFSKEICLHHFWHHCSLIRGQVQATLTQQNIICPPIDMIFYLMETP
ncbi:MAG: hypothetical protein K1X44_07310 [Alphaproteobacteria bacterium]|nr:hypothetical protein [Alphaproteobacteria bacterium]